MSEWKDYKLGDIVNFQNGFAFKSSEFRYDGKYKIIRIKELKNGSVNFFEDTVSVSDEPNNKAMSKFLVNKGDVIFALTGDPVSKSNPNSWVGRVSLYKHNEPAYLNQRTCKITQRGNVIPQYVFYYFRHYDNFYSLASKATGSASQANISTKTLEDTIIILPSLEVQTKIVNILSSLDEKIETNRKINMRLEELAQALFKSWFIDFEPFGGQMPKDWNYKYTSDFHHEIETGKRPKGGVSGITEGVPSIGAESIKGIGYYDYSKTKYIPYEYAESLKKGRIQDFDLLIYKDGGKPGYFIPDFSMMGLGFPFKEMVLNEHVFRLNFGKPELNIFAYFFFKTEEVMNYLNSVGGKAAIPGINQKNVEDVSILDLDIPKVKEFGSIVLPMFKTILENCKESSRLAALRDTLLPKLMSGELIPE